jgi:putative hemolysin
LFLPGLALVVRRPRPFPLAGDELLLLAAGALFLVALFALVRSALLHSLPSRVLEFAADDARRRRLSPLLERAESLATSASVYWTASQILFVVFVWVLVGEFLGGEGLSAPSMGLSLLVTVPLLVVAGEALPSALRGERTDRFLVHALPAFEIAQRPLAALIVALEATRRLFFRLLRIPERPASARELVEGLRAVIEDSERDQGLAESERELIENALSFHDVAVNQVMTPRTDIEAVELSEGVREVVRRMADTGHSRIPVHDGGLDRIVGVAYAQEILQAIANDEAEQRELGSLLRPVLYVPETKLASELLNEFKTKHQKIAVVLDEYGGTAGLVTMGDLVSELMGEMPAELGRREPPPIRRLADGRLLVNGTTKVSELEEELAFELPRGTGYETVAGYVLYELGRFPKKGEKLAREGFELVVSEATDRRVVQVEFRSVAHEEAGR